MKLAILLFSIFSSLSFAEDIFRYKDGQCLNDKGEKGLNLKTIGQCGDLTNTNLSGINLSKVDLRGSNFTNAKLEKTIFTGSDLTDINFSEAELIGAQLHKVILNRTKFKDAVLDRANLTEITANETDFTNASFHSASIGSITCTACNFKRADFIQTELLYSSFTKSNFDEVNFRRTTLSENEFSNSSALKSFFFDSTLERITFKNVSLAQSSFSNSRIKATNFISADCSKCDLTSGAFLNSLIQNSSFNNSYYNSNSVLPFSSEEIKSHKMIFIRKPKTLIIYYINNKEFAQTMVKKLSPMIEFTEISFTGTLDPGLPNLTPYDNVIYFASSYPNSIGQTLLKQLDSFVKNGGTLITTNLFLFSATAAESKDINLMRTDTTDHVALGFTSKEGSDLIRSSRAYTQLPKIIIFDAASVFSGQNSLSTHSDNKILLRDPNGSPALIERELGKGLVYQFSFSCEYEMSCNLEIDYLKLYEDMMNESIFRKAAL